MLSSLLFIRHNRAGAVLLYVLCTFFSFPCEASTFQNGVDAVKHKRYSLAIEYFNLVLDEGLVADEKLPLVHFNLGVCYYRIESFDDANREFKKSMVSNVLLWRSVYNLALVGEKQHRLHYASQLYKKIIADSDNPKLVDLAKNKLEKLSTRSLAESAGSLNATKYVLPKEWAGTISAGLGQDSEVIDPQDLSGSGSSDSFYEMFAGVYRPLIIKDDQSLVFNALAYSLQYETVDEFDVNLISVGLEQQWIRENQSRRVGLSVEQSTVGDEDYLFQYTLHVSNRWRWDSGAKLALKYIYRDFEALDPLYDPLNGLRHELQLTWFRSVNNNRWRARIFALDDDRDDRLDFRGFTSFSAFREGIYGAWDYRGSRNQWKVDLEYRNSHYRGSNTQIDGSEQKREDERTKASVSWQYIISSQWSLDVEYEYINNHSSLDLYDYQGGVSTAGINYEF